MLVFVEFTLAFKNEDKVILFPIYTAGEKLKLGFSNIHFSKDIMLNAYTKLYTNLDIKE